MCIIGLKLKISTYFAATSLSILKRIHYHNLDAIRFIAFFKVFLLHLPEGINTPVFNFLKQGGGTGVSIFFVLSGFLISDILIKQCNQYGHVNPIIFLIRRAFRIWPLFFLGVAIAYMGIALTSYFGISQSEGYMPKPIFSFLFLENYKSILEGTYPRGVPLQVFWSLCIEEHFYLLWILLFMFVPIKHVVKVFGGLWLLAITTRYLTLKYLPEYHINGSEIITSLDYFAVGGLVAAYRNQLLPFKFDYQNRFIRLATISIAIGYIILQHLWFEYLGIFGITTSAFVYGMFIWVMTAQSTKNFIKDNAMISRLGIISYGLYVFHTPIILSLRKLYDFAAIEYQSSIGILLFSILALALSIIVAWLSYNFYEGWFLKIREKYWK